MRTPIAEVMLAIGNVGWFDPLTNIHLTLKNPLGHVFAGQNMENVERGIRFGTIILTAGSLEPAVDFHNEQPKGPEVHVTDEINEEVLAEIADEIIEKQEIALNEVEVPVTEEEAVTEKVEEEEKPKKKAAKKKAVKKEA